MANNNMGVAIMSAQEVGGEVTVWLTSGHKIILNSEKKALYLPLAGENLVHINDSKNKETTTVNLNNVEYIKFHPTLDGTEKGKIEELLREIMEE